MKKTLLFVLSTILLLGMLLTPTSNALASFIPTGSADTSLENQAATASGTAASQPGTATVYSPYTLATQALFSKSMSGAERVAQVYLPGDYAQNPDQRYPVLYVLDGQQLPEMDFEQMLNELTASGAIQPVIVVAVESTEGDLRKEELGTGATLNSFGWGTQSEAFNHFMVDELVPQVNSAYRTLTGPENTAIAGWSLGGLASFYLAWQYPATFGTVGAFSPSFWWRTSDQPDQVEASRVIPSLVASTAARPDLRVWLEAGVSEQPFSDVDNNGVSDMLQDAQDVYNLLLAKGYQADSNVAFTSLENGQHELSTWATVMPDFLKFEFSAG